MNPKDPEFPEFKEKFVGDIRKVFNKDFLENYVYFKDRAPEGSEYTPYWFKSVKIDYAVEVGSKRSFVHAHVFVRISHYTLIGIKREDIREDLDNNMKEDLGIDSPYMNSRFTYGASDSIERVLSYITKDQV
jgi:hypothetical protein